MEFKDNKKSKLKVKLEKAKDIKRLGIHSFHRYYGKLIPAIPHFAIEEYTKEGDLVFDPFVGSGTTAVECAKLNRNFLGCEINELSVMIAKTKTYNYDLEKLKQVEKNICELFENDIDPIKDDEKPFCVNRDHWFKDFVQKDLVIIRRNIIKSTEFLSIDEKGKYSDFLHTLLSAIVKQVSNADTMHVFPGISKRMKRLEAEGQIKIVVFDTFKRALKKRIGYVEEFGNHSSNINILHSSSASEISKKHYNTVDLVVTNPPYISSVRYAETLKLELYWMGICKSSADYIDLSNKMIGDDHIKAKDYKEKFLTNYDFINNYIDELYVIDKKQAKVVYDYFTLMEKVILNLHNLLKKDGKVVIKISDSKIRKIKVPSGELLTKIAELNGFKLIDVFNDKINQNSRSLTTARNTYSDIILEDNIIFWEKI